MRIAALALSFATIAVQAQQARPPTFRAGVLLVPVDVRVVDAQGHPITDLSAADFTILENEVPQQIAGFSTTTYTTESAVPRTFAILIGRGNHKPSNAVDALIDLVRTALLPTDRVSFMAYLHVTDPTTDHAAVLRLLERYRTRSPRIEGRLQRDNRRLSGPNLPLSADTRSEIEQLFEGPGLPPSTILPDGAGGKGLGYNDYGYLARAIEYLRHVDGEKHLLAMLEKRMLLGRDGGDYLGRKAAAARVTVSPITTGGGDSAQSIRKGRVSSGYVGKWDASIDMKRSVDVQNLAELTGGLAASYQEVRKPLARLLRVNSFEYLLGYYPANPPADGEYRQVKVVVNRRGATLHYRHGYESKPKTDEPLDVRGMFTESRILQAASSTYGFVGFPIKIGASVTKGEPLQVVVDVAIDPKQITLTQSGDSYTAALDLAVYVADAHEKMLAEKRDRIELQVRAGELGRIRKEMIRRTVTLNVSRKADQVKVVVYDYDADRLGTASLRIR